MFRRSLKLNNSSYFLQKFFFSLTQKPTTKSLPKNNASSTQNTNKPLFQKKEFKFKLIDNYEGVSKHINDRKEIYEIIKTFTGSPQLSNEFLSNSFQKLQIYSFQAFEEKPGKLIHLLQRIAKQNLESTPSLNDERKKVAMRISNICSKNFSFLQRLDVIMYLWIDVKLGLFNTTMIQKCLQYIENNFSQLNEQDIINYLYSLARIIEVKGELLESNSQNCIIQNHITRIRPQLVENLGNILSISKHEQHLTNLIWSIDRLQIKENSLFTACAKIFENASVRFNNSNLARIINSFVHMQYTPAELCNTLISEFLRRSESLSPSDFVSIIRAFYVSHSIDMTEILNKTEPYFNKNLKNFSKEELVTLFLTYSAVKHDIKVINKILEKITILLPELNKEDLCRTFWSLAVLNDPEKLDIMLKVSTYVSAIKFNEMNPIESHRAATGYFSSYLMCTKTNAVNKDSNTIQELKNNYEKLKERVIENTLSIRYRSFSDKTGSFSVYRTFKALNLEVIPECITEIYNTDFALFGINKDKLLGLEKQVSEGNYQLKGLPEKEHKENEEMVVLDSNVDKSDIILIEIDGQYHFIGDSEVPKATTLLKAWQLEQMGYKLISMTAKDITKIYQIESEKERALELINFIKTRL